MIKLMQIKRLLVTIIIILFNSSAFSQVDSLDVFIFDNFFSPDNNELYTINFSTNIKCKTRVEIKDLSGFSVSDTFSTKHFREIEIKDFIKDGSEKSLKIICQLEDGTEIINDLNSVYLPLAADSVNVIVEQQNYTGNTLFGIFLWLLPSFSNNFSNTNVNSYLNKEQILVSFGSNSSMYEYPYSYFSFEYSYLFNARKNHIYRFGFKRIIEFRNSIEYISPGISSYSDFSGEYGISPEISISLFKVLKYFNFYIKYRFDYNISNSYNNNNIIQFGLFTNLFSIHLNI